MLDDDFIEKLAEAMTRPIREDCRPCGTWHVPPMTQTEREKYIALPCCQIWYPYVSERLHKLSERFPELSQKVLRTAVDLLPDDCPTPSVVPDVDFETNADCICFVWHKNNWTVELEFQLSSCYLWAKHNKYSEEIISGYIEPGVENEDFISILSYLTRVPEV